MLKKLLSLITKKKGTGLKTLIPKQMLQIPIALAKVKECNNSESLLN